MTQKKITIPNRTPRYIIGLMPYFLTFIGAMVIREVTHLNDIVIMTIAALTYAVIAFGCLIVDVHNINKIYDLNDTYEHKHGETIP